MITAIALDDEPPALEVIRSFCEGDNDILLAKTFSSVSEASKYLEKFPVDLLFLDINMPALSGLDFYKRLDQQMMVIFTTAHSEFAIEGFNLNAVDYLLKPFTPERFRQATEKAKAFYQFTHQSGLPKKDYLLVRVDYSLVKIPFADILFIEGLDDYLKVHLKGQKPIVTRMTMKGIIEKLPAKDFIRVHRSYIVSISKIESVRNKMIYTGNYEIPIGTSFEEAFLKAFMGR